MQNDRNTPEQFDHPPTLEEMRRAYTASTEDDPSSINYKRINVRPTVHIGRALFYLISSFILSAAVGVAVFAIWDTVIFAYLSSATVIITLTAVFAKRIAIFCVKTYQRFAPDKVRNRCRFEPSCSQYMIIAIEKYGVIKGIIKGFGRLRRCKPPNGGFDMP